MISDEALLSLSHRNDGSKLGTDPGAPGWVTDGVFMIHVGRVPKGAEPWWKTKRGNMAKLLDKYRKAPSTPVREREDLFMPREFGKCNVCGGTGKQTHRGGVCYWCRGEKELERFVGQVIYEDDAGNQTIIAPKLRCLLECLRVVRIEDTHSGPLNEQPLGGFDGDRLVAVVMPVRDEVKTPAKAKQVAAGE